MKKSIAQTEDPKVRILMSARLRTLPRRLEKNDPRLQLCAQLIDEELLDGWISMDAAGNPFRVLDARLTDAGWNYLMEAREKILRQAIDWKKMPFAVRQSVKAVAALLLLLIVLCLVSKSPGTSVDAKEISVTGDSQTAPDAKVCRLLGNGPLE